MRKVFLLVLATFLSLGVAHAQLGNLGNKLKESVNNNPHLRDWVQRFASALSEE